MDEQASFSLWKPFTKTALLGIARTSQLPETHPQLNSFMNSATTYPLTQSEAVKSVKETQNSISEESNLRDDQVSSHLEERFLDQIASTYLYSRVGQTYPDFEDLQKMMDERQVKLQQSNMNNWSAQHSEKTVNLACPSEELEPITNLTNHFVDSLTHEPSIFKDWLWQLQTRQMRIPHNWIVYFLEFGIHHKEFQQQLTQVVGQRGLWLAKQNKRWSYALSPSPETSVNLDPSLMSEELWKLGTDQERLSILKHLFVIQPKQARQRVYKDFHKEHDLVW